MPHEGVRKRTASQGCRTGSIGLVRAARTVEIAISQMTVLESIGENKLSKKANKVLGALDPCEYRAAERVVFHSVSAPKDR